MLVFTINKIKEIVIKKVKIPLSLNVEVKRDNANKAKNIINNASHVTKSLKKF